MKKTTGPGKPGKPTKVSTKVSPEVVARGKAEKYFREESLNAAKAKAKKETTSKPVSGSFGKLPEGVKSLPKTVKLPQQKINSKVKPVKLPKPKMK